MGRHHHSPFSTAVAPTVNSACTTTGLHSMQEHLQNHSHMFLFKASHIPGPDGLSNPSQDLCKIATHQLQRSPTEVSLHQPSQALKSWPLLLSRSIQSNQLAALLPTPPANGKAEDIAALLVQCKYTEDGV